MIRLKIITNRKLCRNSLEETLEKVLEVYSYKKSDGKVQPKNTLQNTLNTQDRNSEIYAYLKNFEVESIVLREKDIPESSYEKLYLSINKIASEHKIPLFSHSNWNNRIYKEGGRIHLPLYMLEEIYGDREKREEFFSKYREIGVSIHSEKEAVYAEKMGATYITFGHVFETDCKKGLKPKGVKLLKKVCESVSIPVYAIGGINNENAEEAIKNGAYGVCIMSGIMQL